MPISPENLPSNNFLNNGAKKAQIFTFGCRLNHAESNLMEEEVQKMGYHVQKEPLDKGLDSDLYIINSCTVTERADQKCRQLVRSIKRKNPQAQIALVGCYAQTSFKKLQKNEDLDWILGNQEKLKLSNFLTPEKEGEEKKAEKLPKVHVERFEKKPFEQAFLNQYTEARVNLKIQDGCDFFCSFCVIPFARGRSKSRESNDILKEAEHMANLGFEEVVLTGVNLGLYAHNSLNFMGLLERLKKIEKVKRIRISSIEPTTIGDDLLEEMKKTTTKIAPFLHLPIQSANDKTLQAMQRRYTLGEYDSYLKKARENLPHICLGTDLIVGFPGETEEDFLSTYEYLKASELNYLHVFPYSERKNTLSVKIAEKVPPAEIKKRANLCRLLSEEKWQKYQESFLSQEEEVIFEQQNEDKDGKGFYWVGHSAHFLKVKTYSPKPLRKKNIRVQITKREGNYLVAQILD